MIPTFVGMFFGLGLGFVMAGPMGGAVGLVLGLTFGILWSSVRDARVKIPEGAPVVHDEQSILCVPRGRVADVGFLRDGESGRWLDVERCSLCTPDTHVDCAKRCLLLIRDAVPRREHPVRETVGSAS